MKKNIKNIVFILLAAVAIILQGCIDYLDKVPESEAFSDEDVFTSYENSQKFVDQLLEPGGYIVNPFGPKSFGNENKGWRQGMYGTRDRWTDDAMYNTTNSWNWQKNLRVGNFYQTASGGNWWSENHNMRFERKWKGIRIANMAIANADRILDATEADKARILGLAYYMRARLYFDLLQGWGGMPWIAKPLDPEADMDLPRDPYHVTAQKIASTLDTAAMYLPLVVEPGQWGRPSKMAALALKAKALVWAASPFANPGNDKKLWEDAAKAAGEAIVVAENSGYYGLVSINNWRNLFTMVNQEAFREVLDGVFVQNYPGKPQECNDAVNIKSKAFGGTRGAESPTENLAQCYAWSNGDVIDPSSEEYKKFPYTGDGVNHTGRDPRFDLTLIYNRQANAITLRSNRNVEIWNESFNGKNAEELKTSAQYVPQTGYTVTGYYNWKLYPENWYNKDNKSNLMANFMRLADLYLYYAEAANRAWGPTGNPEGVPGLSYTAVNAVNKVRERANMPAYNNSTPSLTIGSTEEFEKKIRNEIRIETAFESKRFYDLRRWRLMLDEEVLVQKGMYIKQTALNVFEYTVVDLQEAYQLKWTEPCYLFPIEPNNTFLGPNFVQNPGW